MTPDRFQQIRNVFEAALERGAGRGAFLTEACGGDGELRQEVERLLEAHESTITMGPDGGAAAAVARTDPSSREGRRIGDYEVLRELGRGGMGSVYLARRADAAFQKNVAIKILRADVASTDVVQRFHREREILAQLDHPNIARLLDAGETEDGLPYFVMEYVEGRSITAYADDKRLSVRDRIGLFRQVCDAVEYAHQRKIVHRDLKPGNVLVTSEGQVKLLDFGIARLLEQDAGMANLTRAGMWLMTPEYASPEQVRGETAGRASDVYSLGVILFELLTGHRPYHMKSRIFHEVVRIVCEEPPTKPSTVITDQLDGRLRQTSLDELKRQLTGDIDNILLKALDKQPQDRYASPQQLRADIDRHLSGEAVWARSGSISYRLGRRASQYGAALVVIAALAAAVATGAVQLSWSALGWMAGATAIICVWQVATNPELGRKLERGWWRHGFVIAIATAPVIIGVVAFNRTIRGDPAQDSWLDGLRNLYWAIPILVLWAFARRRNAGPVILKLPGHRFLRYIAVANILMQIAFLIDRAVSPGLTGSDWSRFVGSSMIWLFIGWTSWVEFRREGLFAGGSLIPWRRITSWSWESDKLVLNVVRRVKFLPPPRIPVKASQKDQVQAILVRHLGDWPSPSDEENRQ